MNIYRVREELKNGKTIYDIPLKVVYYARVSTLKDEQASSISNQQDYYKNFILNNPNWTLTYEYIDHGISGMHVEKREEFQRMIQDAKNGDFDLVITKEIARFARNTLDSIQYTRELLRHGVAVWFQSDSINTIDDDSELRLAIMSSLAQDELRKLSNRVKFGHAQSIKKGRILGTDNLYGYHKKDCKLEIVEEEAEMVRMIFKLYASGEWTTPKIEKHLYELGYRNSKGGKINRRVIGNIITNPKYKGYFAGGKVKVIDMFTKQQEFLPEEDWIMFKDDGETVPAIVDEVLWETANRLFKERGQILKDRKTSYKGDNLYTGKIVCGLDGKHYWLTRKNLRGKNDATWTCSHRKMEGKDACRSFPVKEYEISKMFASLLNEYSMNMSEVKSKYIEIYKKIVQQPSDNDTLIKKLTQQLNEISEKKDRLLDMSLDGLISKDEFRMKNSVLTEKYNSLEVQLSKIEKTVDINEFSAQLDKILNAIKKYEGIQAEDVDKRLVEKLVEKIVITPTSEQSATVDFHLKNGELMHGVVCSRSVNMMLKTFTEQLMYTDRNTGFYKRIKHPLVYTYSLQF